MDDLTDASDNEPEPALLPIEPVEIVPFPNFDNLQPLMPDEVQPEDFLDFLNNPVDHQDPTHHKNLNVGFVQLFQTTPDPQLFPWVEPTPFKPSPEALRLWVKLFSNISVPSPSVIIPDS